MSRPKDQTRDASADAVMSAVTGPGQSPEHATTRMIPCTAATVLRAKLGGSAERSHGITQAAVTKA
jgi:hypothetical protein